MTKSRIFVVALIAFACLSFSAKAQGVVIKAGFTSSQQDLNSLVSEIITSKGASLKTYKSFHVGIGYQTKPFAGFTLQPELIYNRKGSQLTENVKWNLSYLQVPVNIQWGPDLIICRPYLQLTPFVGYCLGSNTSIKNSKGGINIESAVLDKITEVKQNLEYGVGVGAGVEVFDLLQVAFKYSWNFGKVSSAQDYFSQITQTDIKKPQSLEISVGLKF